MQSFFIDLTNAGWEFVRVWGSPDLAGDLAGTLTCTEVEVLHDLFVALDQPEVAGTWLAWHALGDDGGDQHHLDSQHKCPSCEHFRGENPCEHCGHVEGDKSQGWD